MSKIGAHPELDGSFAPVLPSHAKTQYDALPWPGGGKLGDVPPAEFTSRLVAWGIPGASHEQGREANAAAYARHLERLRAEAAQAAVNAFLAEAAKTEATSK
jgi:hypothetical protein